MFCFRLHGERCVRVCLMCVAFVFVFVFSCLSGSGRDGGDHAYRSSDFGCFVWTIVVFLLPVGRRMCFYCVTVLLVCAFVCVVCGFGGSNWNVHMHRLQSGEMAECV